MLEIIIEIVAFALILVGIWHEEKLIAFENRIVDELAKAIAKVIVAHRRKENERRRKSGCKNRNIARAAED